MKKRSMFDEDKRDTLIIKELVSRHNMSLWGASVAWYGSKTKEIMSDPELGFDYVPWVRFYDELLKELTGNPSWMAGTFDC